MQALIRYLSAGIIRSQNMRWNSDESVGLPSSTNSNQGAGLRLINERQAAGKSTDGGAGAWLLQPLPPIPSRLLFHTTPVFVIWRDSSPGSELLPHFKFYILYLDAFSGR